MDNKKEILKFLNEWSEKKIEELRNKIAEDSEKNKLLKEGNKRMKNANDSDFVSDKIKRIGTG